MRLAILCVVLMMLALAYTEAAQAQARSGRHHKNYKMSRKTTATASEMKIKQRKLLIKCCGKTSCKNLTPKKKPRNTNKISTNQTANYSHTKKKQTTFVLKNHSNGTSKEIHSEDGTKTDPVEIQTLAAEDSMTSVALAEEATTQTIDGDPKLETHVSSLKAFDESTASAPKSDMSMESFKTSSSAPIEISNSSSSTLAELGLAFAASSAGATSSTAKSSITGALSSSVENTSTKAAANETTQFFNTTPTTDTTADTTAKTTITAANKINNTANTTILVASSEKITESSTSTTRFSTTTTSPTTTKSTIRTKGYTTATTKIPKVLPSCPSACTKDATLFRFDGTLDDPSSHGFWESGCGELYVFGKSLANWEQNMQKCCSIGMTPLTIDSKDKSDCINKLINGKNWKYNSRYWTSSIRKSETDFKWCNSSAPVDSALWRKNEPNNVNDTENCAQLVISKTNSSARLEDLHCGRITAFACQGPPTPKPPCEAPTCPNNDACEKNKNFYTLLKDGKTSYLTNPTQHGHLVPFDNRSFVFSFQDDTKTFQEAYFACCAIGMKLLSLHQAHKYKSVMGALKSGNLQAAEFWTSGTDLGCKGNYGYCSSSRLLRDEAQWDMAQPDNLNGNEHCLSVNLQYKTALLRDEKCDLKKRYICEARQATSAKIIENECGAAFNLTSEQIKNLMVSFPVLLEEKCFLKCYGEGTDMFINGALIDEKIFAQFTSVSAGDMGKLMEMYSTMNFCSTGTRGMDACDKATQLLKCGKENSPELLQGVMNNLENMIKEAPLVLPPTAGVCPEFPCVIDDELKTMFENAAHQSTIVDTVFSGRVTHSCNKKYLFANYPAGATLEVGLEFCCKFGLRLLTVATPAQLQCLQQFEPYGAFGMGQHFMVAASSLGSLANPKWCFSDTPFYPPAFINYMGTNTDPLLFLVRASFDPTHSGIATSGSPMMYIACESIN